MKHEFAKPTEEHQEAPAKSHADTPNATGYALAVLVALTAAARRTHRPQADVGAALSGAGLLGEAEQVRAALAFLHETGCVSNIVPLSDGGLLVTVIGDRIEGRWRRCEWLPADP